MINFRRITEDNFNIIVHMKRPEGEHFRSEEHTSELQSPS